MISLSLTRGRLYTSPGLHERFLSFIGFEIFVTDFARLFVLLDLAIVFFFLQSTCLFGCFAWFGGRACCSPGKGAIVAVARAME